MEGNKVCEGEGLESRKILNERDVAEEVMEERKSNEEEEEGGKGIWMKV